MVWGMRGQPGFWGSLDDVVHAWAVPDHFRRWEPLNFKCTGNHGVWTSLLVTQYGRRPESCTTSVWDEASVIPKLSLTDALRRATHSMVPRRIHLDLRIHTDIPLHPYAIPILPFVRTQRLRRHPFVHCCIFYLHSEWVGSRLQPAG
jgi:hypothetical protein